ncbi:DsrE family protein [Solidesulfovibrio carbinoliphilus subsp. oakridgensis]|uniref:DsrE family protein n=1 Tax=Solidesulfovibrio carbinoliphilus subsp. oakridgensis TaxID=694327 RepID=G7Q3V4_9BACT|nr:DsrE family protein [Solidesulfovibrio carbinoliphilus]EHJ46744.1 DsrE family protein [Solidesulfovibrio carbinoliphilus subsp. oakridgensis]
MYYDVIFHFDQDAEKLSVALSNVRNYIKALHAESFTIVLVVNGPGIKMMGKTDSQAEQLTELASLGLSVRVCQNALHHFHLKPEWLNPVCQIVPAGIIEIVDLQRKAFTYIKP